MCHAMFWILAIVVVLVVAYVNERHVRWHKPKLYALVHAVLDTILIFLAIIMVVFCILLIKMWHFA